MLFSSTDFDGGEKTAFRRNCSGGLRGRKKLKARGESPPPPEKKTGSNDGAGRKGVMRNQNSGVSIHWPITAHRGERWGGKRRNLFGPNKVWEIQGTN